VRDNCLPLLLLNWYIIFISLVCINKYIIWSKNAPRAICCRVFNTIKYRQGLSRNYKISEMYGSFGRPVDYVTMLVNSGLTGTVSFMTVLNSSSVVSPT
jgi:hypothetical protein